MKSTVSEVKVNSGMGSGRARNMKLHMGKILITVILLCFHAFPVLSQITLGTPGKPYHVNSVGREGFEIDNLVQFMWTDIPNAQYYNVYMSVNGGRLNFAATSQGGTFSFNASGGYKYYIAVAGVDAFGTEGPVSPPSVPVVCDIAKPTVERFNPFNGTRDMETTTPVTVTFSEPMNASDIYLTGVVSLYENSGKVAAELAYDVERAELLVTPKGGYKHGITYTLEISTSATDLAGNRLADKFTLTFTTIQAQRLSLDRLLAYPCPADRRGTSLTYELSQNVDEVMIEVYHVSGDRVRLFDDAPTSEGYNERFWDLRTDDGKEVPNGLYYFRVKGKITSTGEYLETSKFEKLLVLR
ncbi:MAG: hypothetical protein CVV64_01960 [Candidatus Wallbacteria bacterium HGW-Wallbacteria-1]|jgi:hypothetical protein|uniref:SbsA Ig-like domain-containing protein n=1 Tax=Candidatus Wallbacteria bacterium HGW-Wallbacteria-1 TaxID=2013854 RepID=A0A2N1PV41_9BACT|nr:MAG: hypothetical protein CVV64_01960 [Candidatus Wallbacteria bacterium HGW-Wallbacteria-1]